MFGRTLASGFRSLSVRNFRLFSAGQLVSVAGTWTMVVGIVANQPAAMAGVLDIRASEIGALPRHRHAGQQGR